MIYEKKKKKTQRKSNDHRPADVINHSLKLISIKGVEFIMIYYEKLTKSRERERKNSYRP